MTHIYNQKNYNRSFGTFPLQGDELINALTTAIQVGYRAIDTAQMYDNEHTVGEFLKQTDVPREEFLITTKVHPDNFTEQKFIPSVEQSLEKLGVAQVDCLLLHWPCPSGNNTLSLKLLEQCHKLGYTKHIGVSNYNATMLRACANIITTPIVCNQIEFHPLLNQDIMLQASHDTNIPLTAYCPVARGEVFKYDTFANIGKQLGVSAGQVVLKWILQKGVTLQVMSTNPVNIENNYNLDNFTLSGDQMAQIDALTTTGYRIVSEDLVPWCPVWD